MTEKVIIDEKVLFYVLECPLRLDGSGKVPELPVLACAENTARWLIAERFAGRAPTAGETRDFFDVEWKQTAYFQQRSSIPPRKYELRVREGLRACRRLRDIIWRCEILCPVSRYELPIGEVVITGEYAVLRSSRRKKHAFALYLRDGGVKIRRLVPDVVSFARRLDMANRWMDPTNRHWGIQSVGVMHYWVSRDLSAEHRAEYGFTRDMLLGRRASSPAIVSPCPGTIA